MSKTVLALLAHPDDAEFLCAGTLIRLREHGWAVHIATATAGDAGSVTMDRWQTAATRVGEATRAAAMIGAMYHCLGQPDGMVVYDRPALAATIDLLRRVTPTLVLTHAPSDYHVDHEIVSLLARAATFVYAAPNVSGVPLAAHARVPHLYYCDPVQGVDPFGHPVRPTTLIDVTAAFEMKFAMLACHASQREWLRAHHGIDEYTESMRRQSELRGPLLGVPHAEGFIQHRGHAYPADDLLGAVLGGVGARTEDGR